MIHFVKNNLYHVCVSTTVQVITLISVYLTLINSVYEGEPEYFVVLANLASVIFLACLTNVENAQIRSYSYTYPRFYSQVY